MAKFVVLDDGEFNDETIYDSLEEAKDSIEGINDDVSGEEVILYELVP